MSFLSLLIHMVFKLYQVDKYTAMASLCTSDILEGLKLSSLQSHRPMPQRHMHEQEHLPD